MFDTNRILHFMREWRAHMDAQVQALTANVATLTTDVANLTRA